MLSRGGRRGKISLMADLVVPTDLAQALHTFAGYVDDLAQVEFDAASTKLHWS